MYINKKAQTTTGFAVIFFLILLFLLMLYFIFANQVAKEYLTPNVESLINAAPYLNVTERAAQVSEIETYAKIWYSMPIIIVFVLIIWVVVNALKRSKYE